MNNGYDPNSTDATFARILQRMDAQDATLGRIEAGVNKTNSRISSLERDRWYQRGIVAAIAAGAAAAWDFIKA